MTETFHAGPNLGRLSDVTIIHGDCLEAMAELAADSVDAIVTDPPYGLGFMGKAWDELPPGLDWAKQCYRVLKPGGHLLAFGGTRTWHRLAVAVEDAGFEIRDSIAWLYGSGFPKSLDVSQAIDKAAGAEREVVGRYQPPNGTEWNLANDVARTGIGTVGHSDRAASLAITAPATPEAEQWSGWGTALKPAFEPVVVARKPIGGIIRTVCGNCQGEGDTYEKACLECDGSGYVKRKVGGTVAANVLAHGTGALNIDDCRIGMSDADREAARVPSRDKHGYGNFHDGKGRSGERFEPATAGRWPANVVLDADQAAALDQMSGYQKDGVAVKRNRDGKPQGTSSWSLPGAPRDDATYGSGGGASRFFFNAGPSDSPFRYVAKAPKKERPVAETFGCVCGHSWEEHGPWEDHGGAYPYKLCLVADCWCHGWAIERSASKTTSHPTVKPLALMRWLVRLVTPPGGVVLDPFAGSGTTVEAALLEGFRVIGIEREADYLPMIQQRIARCLSS